MPTSDRKPQRALSPTEPSHPLESKRKASTALASAAPKKQKTVGPDGNGAMVVDEPLASQPVASGPAAASQLPSFGDSDSEDEAVLGGKACEQGAIHWSADDLSQSQGDF
jgi:hypothetical protein